MPASGSKRILIYLHYNAHGDLSGHVLYCLQHIRSVYDRIVFVSNSFLRADDHSKIGAYADRIVIRENSGFDFCAWKAGILDTGWEAIRSYDSLTLMNDSCFGPLFDLGEVYRAMEARSVDFWGLTSHKKCIQRTRYFFRLVPEHVQSYCMVFHRRVLISKLFSQFWDRVIPLNDLWDVIVRYEMKLTKLLVSGGFRYRCCVDSAAESSRNANLAHYEPALLLDRGVPFIKIKSFVLSPQRHAVTAMIGQRCDYPLSLIDEHLREYFRPDYSALLSVDSLFVDSGYPAAARPSVSRAAVFLHIHDIKAFNRFLAHRSIAFDGGRQVDCFAAAPEGLAGAEIKALLESSAWPAGVNFKELIEYREGEHPWLSRADILAAYDVAGYFNLRDYEPACEGVRAIGDHRVYDTLLQPMHRIVAAFDENRKLGLVCSDLPFSMARQATAPARRAELSFFKYAVKRLQCRRKIETRDVYSLLTPYASCFWYRPAALAPLRQLFDPDGGGLSADAESVATGLKLLPLYVAWAEGYQQRIAITRDQGGVCWHLQLLRDESQRLTHNHITSNCTWLTGHLLLYLPYQIRQAARKTASRFSAGRKPGCFNRRPGDGGRSAG